MHIKLELPPDEELLSIFGGLAVRLTRPLVTNILSVHTEDEQGELIIYNSAKSGETTLRALIKRHKHCHLRLTGHFHGKVVAPPQAVQLFAARQHAVNEVGSSLIRLNYAARITPHPWWKTCTKSLSQCDTCGEPGESGEACTATVYGDELCDGEVVTHESHNMCSHCDGLLMYVGPLTPWQLHLRISPVVEAQKLARAQAHAARVGSTVPPSWGPVSADLSTDDPTHIIMSDPGHHCRGTQVVPFTEVAIRTITGISGPVGGFLVGEFTSIPDWASNITENIEAEGQANRKERARHWKQEQATRKAQELAEAQELLGLLKEGTE